MGRIIPETAPVYTRGLEKSLLQDPSLAINAAHAALRQESQALIRQVVFMAGERHDGHFSSMVELKNELLKTSNYIDAIVPDAADKRVHDQLVSLFHAMDHTQRLHDRCYEETVRAEILLSMQGADQARQHAIQTLVSIVEDLAQERYLEAAERGAALAAGISDEVDGLRNQVMIMVAQNKISAAEGTRQLEALRWLNRVCDHISRLCHHLAAFNNS